jgi:hypothetical protein
MFLEHIILLFHLWITLPALSALWQILGRWFSSKSEPALFCFTPQTFLKSKPVQNCQKPGITKKISKHHRQLPLNSNSTNSSKQQTANNMSLHQWNSVAERVQLQRYVLLAEMMLEEEEDDDSSDDDSSEEASGGELMDMEMDFIDQELSFITDIDDDNDDEEEEGEPEFKARLSGKSIPDKDVENQIICQRFTWKFKIRVIIPKLLGKVRWKVVSRNSLFMTSVHRTKSL